MLWLLIERDTDSHDGVWFVQFSDKVKSAVKAEMQEWQRQSRDWNGRFEYRIVPADAVQVHRPTGQITFK